VHAFESISRECRLSEPPKKKKKKKPSQAVDENRNKVDRNSTVPPFIDTFIQRLEMFGTIDPSDLGGWTYQWFEHLDLLGVGAPS
jgi:hypothetical protein